MTNLEERVESALELLAASAGSIDVAAARIEHDNRQGRAAGRARPRLAAAAAMVVVAGAAGVWLVQRDPAAPAVPVPVGPADPAMVAVLDPSLGIGAPSRPDPFDAWVDELGGLGRDVQRFVRTDETGAPLAGIRLARISVLYDTWSRLGDPVALADGRTGTRLAFPDDPRRFLLFEADEEPLALIGVGDVTDRQLQNVAEGVLAALNGRVSTISGFDEVPTPALTPPVTSYGPDGPQVTLYDDGDLEARTALFLLFGIGEPAGRTWTAPDLDGGVAVAVDVDGSTAIVTNAGMDPAAIADAVTMVASSEVAIAPPEFDGDPPVSARHEFGDVAAGRWVLSSWTTDGGDGTVPAGQECWWFEASWGAGTGRCGSGPFPECVGAFGNGDIVEPPFPWWALVRGAPRTVTARVDGEAPAIGIIASSGPYTVATGSLDRNDAPLTILLNGQVVDCH